MNETKQAKLKMLNHAYSETVSDCPLQKSQSKICEDDLPGTMIAAVTNANPAPKKRTAVMAKAIFFAMSIIPPPASGSVEPMSMMAPAVLALVADSESLMTPSAASERSKEGLFRLMRVGDVEVRNDTNVVVGFENKVVNASTLLADRKTPMLMQERDDGKLFMVNKLLSVATFGCERDCCFGIF